ncbi:MAG: SDR family NAD(P)-dependent oxidoreductase [Flavobacteriales bacterium]|jgi:short-subunit dehydrogenase|nr:SDR family NAD(P)-dependent oxidoreductase [Flavobacteriales bacterium]
MSKHAVVFGATSGIGKELSKLLVADGYKVLITGRRLEKLEALKAENPQQYIIKQHDVTDIESSDILFKEIIDTLKTIDLVVYSSGVGGPNYNLDWQIEYNTIATNVLGATKIFGLAYNFFKDQGYGHLVGISSIAGVRGNRHVPCYFASKSFMNSYLESLWMKAKRTKNANISVTDIVPGFVETKMATGTTFWKAPLDRATKQIYDAIKSKKKKAYITRRWRFVAILVRIMPAKIVMKYL